MFPNYISIVKINNTIVCTAKASCSKKSNEYVYPILARLVIQVSSDILLYTVCSRYLVRACNMEQRSAIKCCVRLKTSFVETYYMIQQAYGESDPNTVIREVGLSCMTMRQRTQQHFRCEQLMMTFHFVVIQRLLTVFKPFPPCVSCKYEMQFLLSNACCII